jgi:hypothetical protein
MSDNPPVIYVDLIEVEPMDYEKYFNGPGRGHENPKKDWLVYLRLFQPWRVSIKSGDNQKALFRSSERYFNRHDALHAIELAFGSGSNVYLREHERGNAVLRMAVPPSKLTPAEIEGMSKDG